jgi:multiple sugar transport system substrate-binding protein
LQAAIERFRQSHDAVAVEMEIISSDSSHERMLEAVYAKSGPDIIIGGFEWGIEFGQAGGMIDLKEKYPEIYNQIATITHPQVLKQTIASPGGEVFGVPYDLTPMLMYYRTDLVPAPPGTWDELTAEITRQQSAGNQGFMLQWGGIGTIWHGYADFLFAAGGSFYDEGCTKATINSPEGVIALQFYADLFNKYHAPTDDWPDLQSALNSREFSFGISGAWVAFGLDEYPDLVGNWSAATLPAGPSGKGTSFISGRMIGIMSYSKNADIAAEFIRSLYVWETQEAMAQEAASLHIQLGHIPPSAEYYTLIQGPDWLKAVIRDALEDSRSTPNCRGWNDAVDFLTESLRNVVGNNVDPQTALDSVAAKMDDLLSQ